MEVYLIRHTTPHLSPGLIYGHLDVPLSEGFEVEFEKVKANLPEKLEAVYSSPASRCTLLAQQISTQYQTDNRLREMHFGDWEGETWDSVDQADLKVWMDDYVNVRVPGGESMLDLEKRMRLFWGEMQNLSLSKMAIVTHAGVIRMILTIHRNAPLSELFNIKVAYGEVLVVTLEK